MPYMKPPDEQSMPRVASRFRLPMLVIITKSSLHRNPAAFAIVCRAESSISLTDDYAYGFARARGDSTNRHRPMPYAHGVIVSRP